MTVIVFDKGKTSTIVTPAGVRIAYDSYGAGPPLVLIHGSFSDHRSNWMYVKPMLEAKFTVYAVARRGRGKSDTTTGHSVSDEIDDVVAVIHSIGEPVYLLGHSYGAHVALGAAAEVPHLVRKLVVYEPSRPALLTDAQLRLLTELGKRENWDEVATRFFVDGLQVPAEELAHLRGTPDWDEILADAPATLYDLAALTRHEFAVERHRRIGMPVLLQTGSESPRELYMTDSLAAMLPQAKISVLQGQAHEGMTTAPDQFADAVISFLSAR